IAAQFATLGLEPAGPDSSYFQPVALLGLTSHPSLVWGPSGAPQSLKYLDDVVAWAERPDPEITADGEVVFVGYGIRAPEWRWDFRPVATGLHVAVNIVSGVRRVSSENVVAKLPGSDPTLAKQVVLFTAHWDHKGIGPVIHGDSIYNGAEDNASGVAALLAAAQALTQVAPRPRRTLLFVGTTAEESGLLGSEAYVASPLVPLR